MENSSLDILIVEDNPGIRKNYSRLIERRIAVNVLKFGLPSEATAYLSEAKRQPIAYFVDMRTPPEFAGSEELHSFVAAAGKADNFYFMTAHWSEHDWAVLDRTKAKGILKDWKTIVDIVTSLLRQNSLGNSNI